LADRSDILVSKGAPRPLSSDYLGPVTQVHGRDGQGNANLESPVGSAIDVPAPEWIYQLVSADPGNLTILTLGPLTNLALAVQQYPDLPTLVDEVVVMGGNALVPGNASPAAEANMLNDPEAADIVFGQPWRTTMVGLDVTHKVNLTSGDLAKITSKQSALSRHLAAAIPFYQSFFEKTNRIDGIYSHDPTAVAYLVNPSLFSLNAWPIRVETEGFSRGKTWPSLGDTDEAAPAPWLNRPKTSVATQVNGKQVAALIVDRLSAT
ncbi:MAG: nucleoside hydrolase, partial [Pseudomonadales bacterium]